MLHASLGDQKPGFSKKPGFSPCSTPHWATRSPASPRSRASRPAPRSTPHVPYNPRIHPNWPKGKGGQVSHEQDGLYRPGRQPGRPTAFPRRRSPGPPRASAHHNRCCLKVSRNRTGRRSSRSGTLSQCRRSAGHRPHAGSSARRSARRGTPARTGAPGTSWAPDHRPRPAPVRGRRPRWARPDPTPPASAPASLRAPTPGRDCPLSGASAAASAT